MNKAKFIDSPVQVVSFRDIGFSFDFMNFPSLERVNASIFCEYATPKEVQEAEASLRRAVDVHPNRPGIKIERYNEHQMDVSCGDQETGMCNQKNLCACLLLLIVSPLLHHFSCYSTCTCSPFI